MRDLQIWRELVLGSETHVLVEHLQALAVQSTRDRQAFLPAILELSTHADVKVRTLALRCLTGAQGIRPLRAIANAISDENPELREAATDALFGLVTTEPARLVHALFSPHVDVRMRVLDNPKALPWTVQKMLFPLLVDPETRERIHDHVVFEVETLPALLLLEERGLLDRKLAQHAVSHFQYRDLRRILSVFPSRSESAVAQINEAFRTGQQLSVQRTILDRLQLLMWDSEESAHWFSTWSALAQSTDKDPIVTSFMFVLLEFGASNTPTDARALSILVRYDHRVLLYPHLPKKLRALALRTLAEHEESLPTLSVEELVELFASDVVRNELGEIDLASAGWLVRHCRGGITSLMGGFGQEILLVMARQPRSSAQFLRAMPRGNKTKGRTWLLNLMRSMDPQAELVARASMYLEAVQRNAPPEYIDEIFAERSAEEISAEFVRLQPELRTKALKRASSGIVKRTKNLSPILEAWLADRPEHNSVGVALLNAMAAELSTDGFSQECLKLEDAALAELLRVLPFCTFVTMGKEAALAVQLSKHANPQFVAWAKVRLLLSDREEVPAPAKTTVPLSFAETNLIATTTDLRGDIVKIARPCMGITEALAARPIAIADSRVCAAILGSADAIHEIATEVARHAKDTSSFWASVEVEAISLWLGEPQRSLLANATLYRWEARAVEAYKEVKQRSAGGVLDYLCKVTDLAGAGFVVERLWHATARALTFLRYSKTEQSEVLTFYESADVISKLVDRLDSRAGLAVAKLIRLAFDLKLHLSDIEAAKSLIALKLTTADKMVRNELRVIVSMEGVPIRRQEEDEGAPDELRISRDLLELARACKGSSAGSALIAAMRLVELGLAGEEMLLSCMESKPPHMPILSTTLPLWQSIATSETRLRACLVGAPPEARCRVGFALMDVDVVAEAACADDDSAWFDVSDWEHIKQWLGEATAAAHLVESPHPQAYECAVEYWMQHEHRADLLKLFLEKGTTRRHTLRSAVAQHLLHLGDAHGLPVLISSFLSGKLSGEELAPLCLEEDISKVVFAGLDSSQRRLYDLHKLVSHSKGDQFESLSAILLHSRSESERGTALVAMKTRGGSRLAKRRAAKTLAIAQAFSWGVLRGRELTGKLFNFRMAEEGAFGYTRLTTRDIHVTVLPLLRRDRNAQEVVEGLMLHEIGHHLYHASEEGLEIWEDANKKGLGSLVNIVFDEHLERNLRAVHTPYGDRLKKLAAYAFKHRTQELSVSSLLMLLQADAFVVLRDAELSPGFDSDSVRTQNGAILRAMERQGQSFARFFRALRMGLGNRHKDPKVERALLLFGKSFRSASLSRLYDIAKELLEIFGDEAIAAQMFGGHEDTDGDPREGQVHSDGVDGEEVEQEVKRILAPPKQGGGRSSGKSELAINVGESADTSALTKVVPVEHDAVSHKAIAQNVKRHSRRMREFLTDLGLGYVQHKRRLQGHRFDRSRASAVVLRGDPRMLVARSRKSINDLFIGVLIDCSGSMQGASMEKAHTFGVLLAEACKDLNGVDARFFGFTDSEIYDAGSASRCAVASLSPGGGNNDAAALAYVAGVAGRSRRSAKLVIMISDGLPTECSVDALRETVRRVSRRHNICCAQVAVRPLEEQCFEHYTEVKGDLESSVREFGTIAAKLVRATMRN